MKDYYELMINTRSTKYDLRWNSSNPYMSLTVDFNGKELGIDTPIKYTSHDDFDNAIETAMRDLAIKMMSHIKAIQDGSDADIIWFAKSP